MAAVISTTLVNPIDVAKTRLQSHDYSAEAAGETKKSATTITPPKKIPLNRTITTTKFPKLVTTVMRNMSSKELKLSQHLSKYTIRQQILPPLAQNIWRLKTRVENSSLIALFFGKHNTFSILAMMVKEEGFRSFGKGLLPSLLISTP